MDLQISDAQIPALSGKHAVVTGGASGIGLATTRLLADKGATVYLLDVQSPRDSLPPTAVYHRCDVSDWDALVDVFARLDRVDYVFANAARPQGGDPFALATDPATRRPRPPCTAVVATNFLGALWTAVLAVRAMRRHCGGGSVVFTASAAGLSAERGLPVYGALKLGLVGLVRAWRCDLVREDITVNAVAPACTVSGLMPAEGAARLAEQGLQVSAPEHVARALAWSAVGTEERRVEAYGAERVGRWNGRVILTMGDRYTELEEELERLKPAWFGERNWRDTRHGQTVTLGMFGK